MRKMLSLVLILCAVLPLAAQPRVAERTYVATDRTVYVAGDRVWCSVFCLDAATGGLSPVSRVAYLELRPAEGPGATAKVALDGGRGGGYMDLPPTLPTGNYRLIAYTAQNRDEEDYDYDGLSSKTLSVFNVFSAERVPDGVEVVPAEEYGQLRENRSRVKPGMTEKVGLSWSDGVLTLTNHTAEALTLNLSVYHDDGIMQPVNPGIADFVNTIGTVGSRTFRNGEIPDMEGEVVRARVTGIGLEQLSSLVGRQVFLAAPSNRVNLYAAPILGDGQLIFFTGNIYGVQEVVCDIGTQVPVSGVRLEIESPFARPTVSAPEPLVMSPVLETALRQRSLHMQLERQFAADTLYDYLPWLEYRMAGEGIGYQLDDYNRFATLDETFIEFIPQVRVRRDAEGRRQVNVRLEDMVDGRMFSNEPALVLLDGVPVFDHERILAYDPYRVKTIEVFPRTHYVGGRPYAGIVHLITYRHNMPGFKLSPGAQVIGFQGVSWPAAWTGIDAGYPDFREVLYWHPLLRLEAGSTLEIPCLKPRYEGGFRVLVEGLSASGSAVYQNTMLEQGII